MYKIIPAATFVMPYLQRRLDNKLTDPDRVLHPPLICHCPSLRNICCPKHRRGEFQTNPSNLALTRRIDYSSVLQQTAQAPRSRGAEVDPTMNVWFETRRWFHDAAFKVVAERGRRVSSIYILTIYVSLQRLPQRSTDGCAEEEAVLNHAEAGMTLQDRTSRILEAHVEPDLPSVCLLW